MTEKYILSLDLGTSSCRAFALSGSGRVLAQKSILFAPQRPGEGLSQYEAKALLAAQLDVLHGVLNDMGPSYAAGISVSCQRSTVVLWDKTTGEVLAPVLTWEDSRSVAEAAAAPISQEEVHALTGLYKTPYFSAPKIAWCLKNFPQALRAHAEGNLCIGPVASYLVWQLTQGRIFAVDSTLAQRMLLFDIHSQAWSEKLCTAFGISLAALPELRPSSADYGTYHYRGVSIPICAMAGDQQAAAVLAGLEKGESLINYGTGAFWLYHAGESPVVLPGTLTSLSVSSPSQKTSFFLEAPVNAAGSALLWLKAQGFSWAEKETDVLCQSAKQPVWILPALGGLGAPYWDFSISPVFAGLSPYTRPADWIAGMLRSIAFLVTDIASYLKENEMPLKGDILVSGGLSNINYLLQFQSDLLQTPLVAEEVSDATVLGAALLAADYLKWNTKNWHFSQKRERRFLPTLSFREAQDLHAKWKQFLRWCKELKK